MSDIEIPFCTVAGRLFKVSAPPTITIGELKQRLEAEYQLSAPNLKLIYSSAILADDCRISDLHMPPDKSIFVHQSSERIVRPSAARATEQRKPARQKEDPPDFAVRVEMLVSIGFERDLCERALRQANYNPDLAANLLVGNSVKSPETEMQRRGSRDIGTERQQINGLIERLTDDEKRVVRRLLSTGFEEAVVVQVFLACDKDPESTLVCLNTMNSDA